jgi:hypothetical protein
MAAILVMGWWLGTRKARLKRTEQAWLPVALKRASIEFAERYFYTKRPVRLIAKVDRVYKDERATLFVAEHMGQRARAGHLLRFEQLQRSTLPLSRAEGSLTERIAKRVDSGYRFLYSFCDENDPRPS